MTTVEPKWDELVPLPLIFNPKARIILLKSIMIPSNPHYQHPLQHPNIRAAIALYEGGKLDGSKVLIAGGKMVSNEEALEAGLPVWSDVNAMSSLSLKCVLTGDLGRLLSSINAKCHIPVQSANEPAFYETRLFLFLVNFSYLSSLALNRSLITDGLRWTRCLEEDADNVGYCGAWSLRGEERGYRTVRIGTDPSCQRPRKAKNDNQISTFRKGEFCKRTWSRLARNLASRKGNLVTKNARSEVKEFATGMKIGIVFLLPLFFLLRQLPRHF